MSSPSTVHLAHAGQRVSENNPLPVTAGQVAAVREATDASVSYTYEPAVLGGNRITSIVESSATLGLSFTTTLTYVAGTDDIENESIAETP